MSPSTSSRRSDWYRDARVRAPERPLLSLAEPRGLSFAPELLPHLAHPQVASLPSVARERLLDRALARYLHGTSVLEVCVVDETAKEMAHGDAFDLSPRERIEALQLHCDEGYHALLASELLASLEVDERVLGRPAFLDALDRVLVDEARSVDDAIVLRFLFTVVTETSISQSLSALARSRDVRPALRAFVADHARDEARHAAFFGRAFGAFWSRCTPSERARSASLLPKLVDAFLLPSRAVLDEDLDAVGLDAAARSTVIDDCTDALVRAARLGARPVFACFTKAGVAPDALAPALQGGLV